MNGVQIMIVPTVTQRNSLLRSGSTMSAGALSPGVADSIVNFMTWVKVAVSQVPSR